MCWCHPPFIRSPIPSVRDGGSSGHNRGYVVQSYTRMYYNHRSFLPHRWYVCTVQCGTGTIPYCTATNQRAAATTNKENTTTNYQYTQLTGKNWTLSLFLFFLIYHQPTNQPTGHRKEKKEATADSTCNTNTNKERGKKKEGETFVFS